MANNIRFVWEIAREHDDHVWIGGTVTEVLRETSGPWTVHVTPTARGWLVRLHDAPGGGTLTVHADPQRADDLGATILGQMRALSL